MRSCLSFEHANANLVSQLNHVAALEGRVSLESDAEFVSIDHAQEFYNVVAPGALADNNNTKALEKFPMVGQFVSLYFPIGHIKSTRHDDEEFVRVFSASEKWLRMQ